MNTALCTYIYIHMFIYIQIYVHTNMFSEWNSPAGQRDKDISYGGAPPIPHAMEDNAATTTQIPSNFMIPLLGTRVTEKCRVETFVWACPATIDLVAWDVCFIPWYSELWGSYTKKQVPRASASHHVTQGLPDSIWGDVMLQPGIQCRPATSRVGNRPTLNFACVLYHYVCLCMYIYTRIDWFRECT